MADRIVQLKDSEGNNIFPLSSGMPAEMADYIIEDGNDNGWYWRKWNNGRMEAWKMSSILGSENDYMGKVYYTYVVDTYPQSGFIGKPTLWLQTECLFGLHFCSIAQNLPPDTFAYHVTSFDNTRRDIIVYAYVNGYWK